jgi:ubiquinone/menaquinone biosynthesis C-methylase UbiE
MLNDKAGDPEGTYNPGAGPTEGQLEILEGGARPGDAPMSFTGERFTPEISGQIQYEHLHRYGLCLDIVAGRDVLDIASGEGYGSALLARAAGSVVGIDVDPLAVQHAAGRYADQANLRFMSGDCTNIPVASESIDVVISFETLEHITAHDEMLKEVRRVLRPDGCLIISTPDKLIYSDRPAYRNEFHVRELYVDEFRDLLSRNFAHVQLHGQRMVVASAISPLLDGFEAHYGALTGNDGGIEARTSSMPDPIYLIAVCSNDQKSLPKIHPSFFLDPMSDIYDEVDKTRHWASRLNAEHEALVALYRGQEDRIVQSQKQLEMEQARGNQLAARLQQSQRQLEIEESRGAQLAAQLQQSQGQLKAVWRSQSWRVTKPLRASSRLFTALKRADLGGLNHIFSDSK